MLTAAQIARMSQLLDEALELDPEGRRRGLEVLSPQYQDLESALRQALLSGSAVAANSSDLATLPKIGASGNNTEFVISLQAG